MDKCRTFRRIRLLKLLSSRVFDLLPMVTSLVES